MAGAAGRRLLLGLVLLLGAGFLTAPLATAAPACPAVALFAVAGTNETSEAADPARSVGLLAGLTDPLARRWGDDLSVRYVPYPASLDRPVFYPFSEGRGAERLARDAGDLAARCTDTTITLVGFSQGADVVSDVVHRAANGTIALPADRIAGVIMLGSPRRDPRAPNLLDTPGRGVLGPRPTRELDVYDGRRLRGVRARATRSAPPRTSTSPSSATAGPPARTARTRRSRSTACPCSPCSNGRWTPSWCAPRRAR